MQEHLANRAMVSEKDREHSSLDGQYICLYFFLLFFLNCLRIM